MKRGTTWSIWRPTQTSLERQGKKIHAYRALTLLPPQTLVGKLRTSQLLSTSCRAISSLFILHIDFYQYHLIGTIVTFTKHSAFVDYCSLGNPSTVRLSRARYLPFCGINNTFQHVEWYRHGAPQISLPL